MPKPTNLTLGISEPDKVDAYMAQLDHPLRDLTQSLREFIIGIHPEIGEGIYWNAPTFFYTGELQPFDPKSYKRYIVGLNFYRQDELRLIFLKGAEVDEATGFLQGNYTDGRRIASVRSIDDLRSKEEVLKDIIRELIAYIQNS